MLQKAIQIRAVQDKVKELFMEGLLPGTTHLAQGHEGVSVGALAAAQTRDRVFGTYRGHHHALSVGLDPYVLFAEMLGRSTGNCGGMGGSTHAATSVDHNLMGTSLIVGAGIPMSVGAAMTSKLKGDGRVTLSFFGDGATNTGAFHEGLNMAAVWNAPVVFIIENNQYAEYTPAHIGTSVADLAIRAVSYGMSGRSVDGQDAVAVHNVVAEAIHKARSGGGPSLIEAKTYRYSGHSRTDPAKYRPVGELERWKMADPIDVMAARLSAQAALTDDELNAWRVRTVAEVDAAASQAAQDPFPTMEEARAHVFA
ncbi:thiamine pyrophosphate-dependent dehydrogenase E1 component subunit alpha [Mycolicibacterium sp. 624]|uniref:thiamine pyrophosphate-dependent dehydrogenase E1 component subunit alpha n=1 Tax=Mycolicibacterium sp. 624 TaxID=3156314 RepID=UPI0033939A8B